VFANPLPSAGRLTEYYSEGGAFAVDLQGQGLPGWKDPRGPRVAGPHTPRRSITDREARALRAQFGPVAEFVDVLHPPPGAKVLDYGCGPGKLLDRLKAAGWTTYGIEPAIKSAFRQHHELHALPADPTFELVTCYHVLEHLRDPLVVLQALSRSLVEGGILYLSVPRLDTLAVHRKFQYCLNPPKHLIAYTWDALATLMEMAGLTPLTQPETETANAPPTRLQMFARKVRSAPNRRLPWRTGSPLRAAEDALRAYYGGRAPSPLSVHLYAGWLRSAGAGDRT
jgi:SAM-dependent methyltransferase